MERLQGPTLPNHLPGLFFNVFHMVLTDCPGDSVIKNLLANAGDTEDTGSVPGSGRSSGGGNSNPLQYSCLGDPTDRGAWPAAVQGVARVN